MKFPVTEATYPLKYREHDATLLADHLRLNHSIELVGMKRVGINNFLRFFIFQRHIEKKYIHQDGKNILILVDLNDLVERDLFSFWRLTLKRIIDSVEMHIADQAVKEKISSLFLRCIQTGDFFLTYDGVRECLVYLTREGYLPTLFFTRFDRLKDVASIEFFDNLKSIRDATGHKLSYVFTSFRELAETFPVANDNELISRFLNTMYIKPLSFSDERLIMETLLKKYNLELPQAFQDLILVLAGGHIQYLHLCMIIAYELFRTNTNIQRDELIQEIEQDERITFLSEELWESLSDIEQKILIKILNQEEISSEDQVSAVYLWNTGMVTDKKNKQVICSNLFSSYVKTRNTNGQNGTMDMSKKEYALFHYLKINFNEICDRESIAEVVWPEYKEYGVSDWTIDRLVARVRNKLKKQKSEFEIITIRTRGYKLISGLENTLI